VTSRPTLRGAALAGLTGAVSLATVLAPTGALAARAPVTATGPSSSVSTYVLPAADGVSITSRWSVGDKAGNDYRMVGIPDGLGVSVGADGLDVYLNHELTSNVGTVRDHGQKGAFVSHEVIDPATGAVVSGDDLIKSVRYWDYPTSTYVSAASVKTPFTAAFARFCSGALTAPGQLWDAASGTGYDGQIYFANEENGANGRAFGVTADGTATQLPHLGLFSWENTLAAQTGTLRTVVMGDEDDAAGQLRVYSGSKQADGTPVERAGLANGTLHVVKVDGVASAATPALRTTAGFTKGVAKRFTLPEIDWTASGAAQNTEALADGTTFNRIEDGAFDPRTPNDYYFLTTEGGDTTAAEPGVTRDGGGLWRLRYDDVSRPELGGTVTLLLDGTEAPFLNKPDNMTIDAHGNLLMQEDPGGNAHVARIVAYRIEDGARGVVAEFDPARFAVGAPGLITTDEESSGIIDVSSQVGQKGTFLFDAQVHAPAANPEYVEKGQLLAMKVDSFNRVYR
jgi:hypothetical protein